MRFLLLSISLFITSGLFSQELMGPYGSFPQTWGESGNQTIYGFLNDVSYGSGGQVTKDLNSTEGYYLVGYKTTLTEMKDVYLGFYYQDTLRAEYNYGSSNDDVGFWISPYRAMMAKGDALAIAGYSYNGADKDAMLLPVEYDGSINSSALTYDGGFGDDVFYFTSQYSEMEQISAGFTSTLDNHNDILLCITMNDYYGGPSFVGDPFVFGGPGDDVARCGMELFEGEFWFGGYTTSEGAGNLDGYVFQFTSDQIVQWDTTFGTPANEVFYSMADENYMGTIGLAGYSDSTGNKDFYIVGLNPYSHSYWSLTAGGDGDEEAYSIQFISNDTEGYFLVTGYTTSFGPDTAVYVVKIDRDGNKLWEGYVDEPGNQIAYATYIDKCDIIFGGKNDVSGSDDDFFLASWPAIDIVPRVTDVSCYGNNDGGVRVFMYGSSYNTSINYYDYLGNSYASGLDSLNEMEPGTYHVELFDMYFGSGCFYSDSFEIIEPALFETSIAWTDVSCNEESNGTATITPTGGVEPYYYEWSDGQSTQTATGLTEDILYYVDVYDDHGCYSNQEFMLSKLALGGINGFIMPTIIGDIPDELAQAELYKINGLGNAELVTSVPVYSMGFGFSDIEPGNYIIKINVDPSLQPQLLPTYYQSEFNWEDALVLEMDCDVYIDDADVTLKESDVVFDGTGSLSGTVLLYDYTPGSKDFGEPVPGAEIYLEQEPEGEPIAVTETDLDGDYEIDSIPLGGDYSLSVDIPGFPLIQTYSDIPINSTDSVYENLNFYVDTTGGSEGIYTEDPTGTTTYQLPNATINAYPNPSTDQLNIDITLVEDGNIMISLLDINGKLIKVIQKEHLDKGEHHLVISPASFPSKGNYFISCKINNNVLLKKIVRI